VSVAINGSAHEGERAAQDAILRHK
jgi:hypothetical protein